MPLVEAYQRGCLQIKEFGVLSNGSRVPRANKPVKEKMFRKGGSLRGRAALLIGKNILLLIFVLDSIARLKFLPDSPAEYRLPSSPAECSRLSTLGIPVHCSQSNGDGCCQE
jgi:hypothetical protein